MLSKSFKWSGVNKLGFVLTATLNLLKVAQVVAFALEVSIKGTSNMYEPDLCLRLVLAYVSNVHVCQPENREKVGSLKEIVAKFPRKCGGIHGNKVEIENKFIPACNRIYS